MCSRMYHKKKKVCKKRWKRANISRKIVDLADSPWTARVSAAKLRNIVGPY